MTDRAVTRTWLVLVAITVGSWWLAPAQYSEALRASVPVTALVLALTLVKSRLIIRQFMEVRTAPGGSSSPPTGGWWCCSGRSSPSI